GTNMRAIPASAGRWSLIPVLVVGAALCAFDVGAAQQDKPGKKDEPPKIQPKSSDTPPAKTEVPKTYAFEMRNKPWIQVMEWLPAHTGLRFIGPTVPQGTFNFIAPKKKEYTIPEIIDFINEGLLSADEKNRFTLLRREQSFTLVPADVALPEELIPRVRLDELDSRGNSEVVSVTFQAKGLVAEDIAQDIAKQLMGPFGKAVAFSQANQLVLRDTAGNLKRIVKTLKDIAEESGGSAGNYSHQCKYIKARDA